MDKINKEVADAMHTLASALVNRPKSKTRFNIDYDKEQIIFEFGDFIGVKYTANCCCDSQQASIKDFAKQIIMEIVL